ncbi:23S rRNA (uracil(747)-C(5))-methyltransferase RlmC [Rheinheimera sp. 4Y26]|uniref:23S rRNA (uracil(747)-C(5))-methyltransferase RlmC n=1 Tax=Rheinheimera sp. 4Y26 TaxID=2977811 RepID=UPI0021B0D480|nr:23S rRNA (uracil(747)-C(5))-methyltransferase RlmC [Rheinheimera sp. 4Y26]MCT6700039.1 23S rRNA (uracil(747)-C(5))-methyltransferase RlmC [Rheinheimera sp. 4Y26]
MLCPYFIADTCRSCSALDMAYAAQLDAKQQQLQKLLGNFSGYQLLPAAASSEAAFRNKAKMVVMGSADEPVLGIVNHYQQQVELTACPLYPPAFAQAFAHIRSFIRLAKLQPYQLADKKGELKFVLLTQSQATGQWMLRFVLRSKNHLASIIKHLPTLQQQWSELLVCSVNLQPEHKAVLEGETEIVLTEQQQLPEQLNDVPLFIQPQSFFQTNPTLAAQLYQSARDWTADLPITRLWDLFCGVGGFALHLAKSGREITGIEISSAAIACAQRSAALMQNVKLQFQALDADAFAKAQQQSPDLLVVNPPRRGLGAELCRTVSQLQPAWLLYSSCNPQSLVQDLTVLADYQLEKAQLFDFFPHTKHAEVLCLLKRRESNA